MSMDTTPTGRGMTSTRQRTARMGACRTARPPSAGTGRTASASRTAGRAHATVACPAGVEEQPPHLPALLNSTTSGGSPQASVSLIDFPSDGQYFQAPGLAREPITPKR
ncbi:hypothetical protein RSP797_07325 [Ralstonia solanacearum]|nr:hypothetical protein RSP797_07325 [Ralstonia solanacearum]